MLGPEHPDTLAAMHEVGSAYWLRKAYEKAESLETQLVRIKRRVLGPEHPDTLAAMHNLAVVYGVRKQFDKSELLYKEVLEIKHRVLGPEHLETLGIMELAAHYYNRDLYTEAEPLLTQVLEIKCRVLGLEHPNTLGTMDLLAIVYGEQGQYGKEESLLIQWVEIMRRTRNDADGPGWLLPFALYRLSLNLLHQGRYVEAEPAARESMMIDRKNFPDDWALRLRECARGHPGRPEEVRRRGAAAPVRL